MAPIDYKYISLILPVQRCKNLLKILIYSRAIHTKIVYFFYYFVRQWVWNTLLRRVRLCIVVLCMCPFDHIVVIKGASFTYLCPRVFFSWYLLVFLRFHSSVPYFFVTHSNIFNKHLTVLENLNLICNFEL